MVILPKRLRELRERHGLTQEQFAKIINKSKSSVNMYERGEREPSFETAEAIADYFNVTLDSLVKGEDSQVEVDPVLGEIFKPDVLVLASRLNALPEGERSDVIAAIHTLLSKK